MIYKVHEHSRFATAAELAFILLVFFTLTIFFFYTFLNICFQNIVTDPPIPIMAVLFTVLLADLVADIYISQSVLFLRIGVNLCIIVLLFLSWVLNNQIIFYFSASVFIRFPEVVYFSDIIRDQLRGKKPALYKLYVLLKIIYMMAVVGHVTGCIFYAIDESLIKAQYYGSIQYNPSLYYQGQVACFTPIQDLPEIYRYVYAMYYINSLVSTVAYGDIIPHNPIENAYVVFLLVFSTASVSFIIEQMVIVYRSEQDNNYALLRRVKFFDHMLWQAEIPTRKRNALSTFIIASSSLKANWEPKIKNLSNEMKALLFLTALDPSSKFMTTFLPPMLPRFFMDRFKLTTFGEGYTLLDNYQEDKLSSSHFSVKVMSQGEVRVGYGSKMLCSTVTKEKGYMVGWTQFLWRTKMVHLYLKIETVEPSTFYSLELKDFTEIRQHQQGGKYNENYEIFVERLQMERDHQLFDSRVLECWICKGMGHYPNKCNGIHYRPTFLTISQEMHRNHRFSRTNTRACGKIHGLHPVFIRREANRQHNQFWLSKQRTIDFLKSKFQGSGADKSLFEKCDKYKHFYPNFNIHSI